MKHQMFGTLQNVSGLTDFLVPQKIIKEKPLNANHTAASTQNF